tara:strand:- start:149 stop:1879 length:1731 start_codon:yes stop_codon:yes gene_type:complete
MPETQGQYIATPTYGALFQDTYLKTHRQRMETSIQMAQQEVVSSMELLKYYQKKEKQYLDYIEEVGVLGSSKTDQKTFNRQLAVLKLKQKVKADGQDMDMKTEAYVDKQFSPDDNASVNKVAREAALALPGGISRVETALAGINTTAGSTQALATAVQLYGQMETEAQNSGTLNAFNANKPAIRRAIAKYTGRSDAEVILKNPQALVKMKADEKARLKALTPETLSTTELKGIMKSAGIAPEESGTKEVSEIAKQQEQIMADRLAKVQTTMSDLEDKMSQQVSAEDMMKRAREIYSNEFANSKSRRDVKKMQKQNKRALADMDPDKRYILDAYMEAKTKSVNPYFYVPSDDNGASIESKANELMNTIINNKGSGNPIDVVALSNAMGSDNKQSQAILGAALKGVLTHAKETSPQLETAAAQQVEQQGLAAEEVVEEMASGIEIAQEKVAVANKEVAAPVSVQTLANGLTTDGAITPYAQAPKAFGSQQEVDAFLASKFGMPAAPPPVFNPIGKAPDWYDDGNKVEKTEAGGFIVNSPRFGNFTLDPTGKLVEGEIKLGNATGHYDDLIKANKEGAQ